MEITPKNFAEQISKKVLRIACPPIKADASKLQGSSLAALIDGTLYYNPDLKSWDVYFSIAHELRHVWQMKKHRFTYFKDYKTREDLSVTEYNNQSAELDANAFGALIMEVTFGVQPRFVGLDEATKKKIFALSERLNNEYLINGYFK